MFATLAAATVGLAIVAQDQTLLRAAPANNATAQATLWPGDLLEVRGERLDHLQVWDHQRERGGYVRATQLRLLSLQEADAPQLLAVLRFLRDTPGSEPLGIAYAAAYLKAAPASGITAEPFDALGSMAERLARRASSRSGRGSETVAGHLEVAGRYGVKFTSFEREGAMQMCYEGDAFRRVLALPATPEQLARAALALTRHDCIDPTMLARERQQLDRWRADVLDRVPAAAFAQLAEPLRNRLRLRRAGVWAAVTLTRGRDSAVAPATMAAAQRAIDEYAAVNTSELTDDDQQDYGEAALRVGAARAAALPAPVLADGRPALTPQPGEPGQTCMLLTDSSHPANAPLLKRCTYGVPWPGSLRVSSDGRTLVQAVQLLEGWTELWVWRGDAQGWHVNALPPAAAAPSLGYAEFAGWVPGGAQVLVAREALADGRARRSFEIISLDSLAVVKQALSPQWLTPFYRWQDPLWKRSTLSLR